MDTGEGHFIATVSVRKVFPVTGLGSERTCKLRNRYILLPRQIGRIGKGPQIFRPFQSADLFADLAVIGLQRMNSPFRRWLGAGIDLCLILGKITRNMAVMGKRMRCMCH